MAATRENDVYLPGFPLPPEVEVTPDIAAALEDADVVLSVVPSHLLRRVYRQIAPFLNDSMVLVSATKGIENETLLLMSDVIRQEVGPSLSGRIAVISGPTFAREVAHLDPTALVVAAGNPEIAASVQKAFSGPSFRLYTSADPVGVEVGGAIKNVVAIGAGVLHGLGLGSNPVAALVTRGLAEMTRLAVAMGGQPKTLAGLAGLGDLVLTCTGDLSRNRTVGVELAHGRKLDEIVASMRMVAEGIKTTNATVDLARRYSVEIPIAEQMYRMLHHGLAPREAIQMLMERSLKGE
jgi:glycerol-3-phosphate dehydrogenase (NAD(P)+)